MRGQWLAASAAMMLPCNIGEPPDCPVNIGYATSRFPYTYPPPPSPSPPSLPSTPAFALYSRGLCRAVNQDIKFYNIAQGAIARVSFSPAHADSPQCKTPRIALQPRTERRALVPTPPDGASCFYWLFTEGMASKLTADCRITSYFEAR